MKNGKSAKGRAARGGRVPSAEPARGTDGRHGDTQGPHTQQACCLRGTEEPKRGPQAGGSKSRAGAGWGQVFRYKPAWLCAGTAQGSERGTRQGLGLQKEAALKYKYNHLPAFIR